MTFIYVLLFCWLIWLVLSLGKRIKSQEKRLEALETRFMADMEGVSEPVPMEMPSESEDLKVSGQQQILVAETIQPTPVQKPVTKKSIEKQPKPVPEWRKNLFSVESIISKLGILLLLIGVGYIFKLAYDNGYITEELAVLMGLLLGLVFLGIGVRVGRRGRQVLSQVLYGGGIATLYITIYAAYQGYGLIPGILAFVLMCTVTGLGFVLAMVSNSVVMSVIAVLGGLLTPFLLQLEQLGLMGTGIYVLMMAVAGSIIYVFRRWRMLQLSVIGGTYLVTTYFITLTGISVEDKTRLAFLMLALCLVYNGTEYVLALIDRASAKYPMITYSLFAALPLVTLLQIWNILSLKESQWSLIFALVSLMFVLLSYWLHRKDTDPLVVNIALSHFALFALFAAILRFGGDIRVVAIGGLALVLYALGKKSRNWYTSLLGHLLMLIAFGYAVFELVNQTMDHEATLIELAVRLLITLMFLAAMFLNNGMPRQIIGIMAIEVYLLLVWQIQVYQLSSDWEPLATMVVAHGFFIGALYLISRRLEVVPAVSVIAVSVLPFLTKIVASMVLLYTRDLNWYELAAFLVYSILMYALAQFNMKEIPLAIRMSVKLMVYTLIVMLIMTDLVVATDYLVLGLLGVGALLFVLEYLETDRLTGWMSNYRLVLRSAWLLITFGYVLYGFVESGFQWQKLFMDLLLLPLLWLNLKHYKWFIPRIAIAGIQGVAFMLVTYSNLSSLTYGRGAITLLWAAYAIALLTYSVVKANKQLVTLSLVFIVAVAVKYIVVDLATVNTLWKIIISMAFGTALLTLSYFLQPILSGQKEEH